MRNSRYGMVPIIATILKVIAVLILLFFIYQTIAGMVAAVQSWQGGASVYGQVPPVTGFWRKFATLLSPFFNLLLGILIASLAWGFAELFEMVRDIVVGKPVTALPADGE